MHALALFLLWGLGFAPGLFLGALLGRGLACRWAARQIEGRLHHARPEAPPIDGHAIWGSPYSQAMGPRRRRSSTPGHRGDR